MRILNHRLVSDARPIEQASSPNQSAGLTPEYLVLHFTAGASFASSKAWLTNPSAHASAHLLVGRGGELAQLVPFNRKAWHAGESRWTGRVGLNAWSIGIEFDNAGPLQRVGTTWKSWFGSTVSDEEVLVAPHKHGGEPKGWQVFTEAQLEAGLQAVVALHGRYGFKDILGHEDIAPGRKQDPGPAFPLATFRARVLGRQDEGLQTRFTTTHLHIRSGPGTQHPTLPTSPLAPGTEVEVVGGAPPWAEVIVATGDPGVAPVSGWVHSAYLRA